MCISDSVGRNAANNPADVKMVQALLNQNIAQLAPNTPLVVDGQIGPTTLTMIGAFQQRVLQMAEPDQRIDPAGLTLSKLHAGISSDLTSDSLGAIMLSANAATIAKYLQPLITMMANNLINTPLRMAHFLAQIGHESADLRYSQEIADGSAYEGRADLGNTQPGDGPRFKGRGLIQLTGRANYVAYGNARHQDFVTPENYLLIATDPQLAVDVSCWFWTTHGLNALADADDLNTITRRINGGLNGLEDRQSHLDRAKCLLVP